jgi:hypothetical protein
MELKLLLSEVFEKPILKCYGFETFCYEPRKVVIKIAFQNEDMISYFSKEELLPLIEDSFLSDIQKEQLKLFFDEAENESYSRNELISICENSVVPYFCWENRDSYIAQVNISTAYSLLKSGAPYKIDSVDEETIWLSFPITEEVFDEKCKYTLTIDSRDDYLAEHGYDKEMFEANQLARSDTYYTAFLPTLKRLSAAAGKDWY